MKFGTVTLLVKVILKMWFFNVFVHLLNFYWALKSEFKVTDVIPFNCLYFWGRLFDLNRSGANWKLLKRFLHVCTPNLNSTSNAEMSQHSFWHSISYQSLLGIQLGKVGKMMSVHIMLSFWSFVFYVWHMLKNHAKVLWPNLNFWVRYWILFFILKWRVGWFILLWQQMLWFYFCMTVINPICQVFNEITDKKI